MMPRVMRSSLTALLLMAIFVLAANPVPACGPFALDAVFTFVVHPEFPLEKYAQGEMGVVQPTFARSYLVVAYRNLNGVPFDESQRKQLLELWQERLDSSWPDSNEEEWSKPWITARQMVPGVAALGSVSTSRHREKPDQYESYINCQRDAFENAANTLTERMKKFGADSAVIKDWVAAQDEVFANCSEGDRVPAAAAADADPLIKADRAYQIAAARFYAANFDEASKAFEAIARDASSPWQQIAVYLSARTLLRKASLGPAETRTDSLTQSEAMLQKILKDKNFASIHPAASRLLNLARLRLRPEERVSELAQALQKKSDENLKQDLWDYTILLDDYLPSEESDKSTPAPDSILKDDLTDWIVTIQAGDAASLNHAVDRWRATSAMPWLVAALTKTEPGQAHLSAVLAAADKVSPASPAFASVMYHRLRLTFESGNVDEARTKLDDLLAKHRDKLPASSVNIFLGLRMRLASNLSEFLKFAQRLPAGFTWNEDGREIPADPADESDEGKALAKQILFDVDGARVLNEKLPLSLLQQAASAGTLPERLQRDVTQASWLRAVLLDDEKHAREISPTLRKVVPSIAPLVDQYLSAPGPEAKKFAGIYAWLKFPGLQPMVTSGIGRGTPLNEQDSYRDNWWCGATLLPPDPEESSAGKDTSAPAVTANVDAGSPLFLTVAQKTAAKNEYARLRALGAAPNYLAKETIAWVEKHPTDPRGPEALHLAVKSTRYGCTDKASGRWSKAAYDLLHKRFPNNPWTKKTPYWFKE